MKILYDANALQTKRLFPESRHRSARILKKLIKRHGGEFRREPCIIRYGDTFVAHPIFERRLIACTVPAPAAPIGGFGIDLAGHRWP